MRHIKRPTRQQPRWIQTLCQINNALGVEFYTSCIDHYVDNALPVPLTDGLSMYLMGGEL